MASLAPNTREMYSYAWRAFASWCEIAGATPLPATPATVRNFATWCLDKGYRMGTVKVRLRGIAYQHGVNGFASPLDRSVREHMANARRHYRHAPAGKRAVTCQMLRKMLSRLPETPTGIRNRAMILVTFAAGWRRGEVTALQFSDLRFVPSGMELWLRSSKTDQVGEGRLVGIQPGDHAATCPILALRCWLAIRGEWDGPLFPAIDHGEVTRRQLHWRGQRLCFVVKRLVEQIGEDPRRYGAHSLRAGMVTESAKNGASEAAIMARTGHRSSRTLQIYIRPNSCFDFNPLKGVL